MTTTTHPTFKPSSSYYCEFNTQITNTADVVETVNALYQQILLTIPPDYLSKCEFTRSEKGIGWQYIGTKTIHHEAK